MSRRRLVALSSAAAILGVLIVAILAFLAITQTDYGRDQVRRILLGRIAAAMKGRGSMYIGRIRGSFLTGVTVDSFAIRDVEDSLFVSTGPLTVHYDPRDLFDKRILVSHLRIERPVVNLRRHADGTWNFKRIFPSGPDQPPATTPERNFGDFIVIDSTEVRSGLVILTQAWDVPDTLRKAQRDSAAAAALSDWRCGSDFRTVPDWLGHPCGREVRPTAEGLKRTYRWNIRQGTFGRILIADPDSVGRRFDIARLDVDEPDPPFAFRNVRGEARWRGDTLSFDAPHFDLPASTGAARGRLHWGPGPMVYDIDVTGDSVTLADVNWVYPTLPTTGGGRLRLHIGNDARDPNILEYALRDMDVRTTGSHLVGNMTFAVGAPVLAVKDVALRADPVDFKLLETLNGQPFPVPYRGQIRGDVRARGGPLTRFVVDEARFAFADANVTGAVTRGTAHGGLDILVPGRTRFRGLDVDLQRLDLRTIRYLFPSFAHLDGTISGHARLDSIWTDVRFTNADLTHLDGPGIPTHATGSGRITDGAQLSVDVSLQLVPASLTMLARSYPIIPFRGSYAGPLVARGRTDSLWIETTLTGAAGQFAYTGWVSTDSSRGYASYGVARATKLDVRTLLDRPALPDARLSGDVTTAIRFDSLADLRGTLDVQLGHSRVDAVHIFPSGAHLTFGNGRVQIDSLRLETSAAVVTAHGGVGLQPTVGDTLYYTTVVDSLGGLRPYLDRLDRSESDSAGLRTAAGGDSLARTDSLTRALRDSLRDSLAGTFRVDGTLAGAVVPTGTTRLDAAGTLIGRDLFVRGYQVTRVDGRFAIADVTGARRGTASLALDTMRLAGIVLASARTVLRLDDSTHGRLTVQAQTITGPQVATAFDWSRVADTLDLHVDTLEARVGAHRWALSRPAFVHRDSTGLSVDSIVLRHSGGTSEGAFVVAGILPTTGPVDFHLAIDSLDLEDAASLAQTRTSLDGWLSARLELRGTRAAPLMELNVLTDSVRVGASLHVPRASLRASYAQRQLHARLELYRNGKTVLVGAGTAPVDLALVPVGTRLLPDSLGFRLQADSVDLALIEAMAPGYAKGAAGLLSTDIDITGTWHRPTLAGRFAVSRGEIGLPRLGIRLHGITADVGLARDSIRIRQLEAWSGGRNGRASLTGGIALPTQSLGDHTHLAFDLRLHAVHFQAIRQRRLADLEVSGDLRLLGPFTGTQLTGNLTVDRGALYIQDAPQKQLVSPDDPDFMTLIDTTNRANRRLVEAPSAVDTLIRYLAVENIGISLGDEVWLRSTAANIKLGGSVQALKTGDRLALAGTLRADRGEYRLDLGLVQRRFDVTQGTISFYGEPGFDPALDITAVHTVRQVDRPDVRVRAVIGGTLLQPRLTLTSDERIPLSTTEILSYLVFGVPSFALPVQGQSALRPVAQALLPTAGVLLERQLTTILGGFVDNVQIQAGGLSDQDGLTQTGVTNVLSGSRIGIGKQIGDRTFITANAGLCRLAGQSAAGAITFGQSLGVSVEVRLNMGFLVQGGLEPAALALLCNHAGTLGYVNTPRQFGFDLFREWSF